MRRHFKKGLLLSGAAVLLAACQPHGPELEVLQKLRDVDSGIEITNSRIKSVTEINDTVSLYDIEGMFKYRDGRYQYLTNLGNIEIYTPLNGEEANPFNATVMASAEGKTWDIVRETLPTFTGPVTEKPTAENVNLITYETLFKGSEEYQPGFFKREDGAIFALNDKALDKSVKTLVKGYESHLKENLELDKQLIKTESDLQALQEKIEKETRKDLAKEGLKGEALELKLFETLTQTLAANERYQVLLAKVQTEQAEIKLLHSKMPALWAVEACYETNYRFYGRLCNQITGANRSYLPEIRYQNRPDADLKLIK